MAIAAPCLATPFIIFDMYIHTNVVQVIVNYPDLYLLHVHMHYCNMCEKLHMQARVHMFEI